MLLIRARDASEPSASEYVLSLHPRGGVTPAKPVYPRDLVIDRTRVIYKSWPMYVTRGTILETMERFEKFTREDR